MTSRRVRLFSLAVLLLSFISAAGFARFPSAAQETAPKTNADEPALKEISDYRLWTKATEKPMLVHGLDVPV